MDAKKYISFYYGDKEKAIEQLEKSIQLYDNANRKTPKVIRRIEEYKNLLEEVQQSNF
ncbi:MAG: hypothetical protein V4683_12090 [Bacteroidota bacterium]|jgi:prefoldin subunit 5